MRITTADCYLEFALSCFDNPGHQYAFFAEDFSDMVICRGSHRPPLVFPDILLLGVVFFFERFAPFPSPLLSERFDI